MFIHSEAALTPDNCLVSRRSDGGSGALTPPPPQQPRPVRSPPTPPPWSTTAQRPVRTLNRVAAHRPSLSKAVCLSAVSFVTARCLQCFSLRLCDCRTSYMRCWLYLRVREHRNYIYQSAVSPFCQLIEVATARYTQHRTAGSLLQNHVLHCAVPSPPVHVRHRRYQQPMTPGHPVTAGRDPSPPVHTADDARSPRHRRPTGLVA